jgi:hypothetical protein
MGAINCFRIRWKIWNVNLKLDPLLDKINWLLYTLINAKKDFVWLFRLNMLRDKLVILFKWWPDYKMFFFIVTVVLIFM